MPRYEYKCEAGHSYEIECSADERDKREKLGCGITEIDSRFFPSVGVKPCLKPLKRVWSGFGIKWNCSKF